MADEPQEEETTVSDDGEDGDHGKEKPWYPYITKTQFEKFLSRLQSKVPDEIDRDYVRAIIRTPSMIYRFLRGVEAMGLIDAEQRPTDRLRALVEKDTRKKALAEVVRDLYPILMEKIDEADGEMADRDIVAFFRKETGMGNDSANKMKMFFKYLLSEADGETAPAAEAETEEAAAEPEAAVEETAESDDSDDDADDDGDGEEEEAEAPAPDRSRGGQAERRSQRGERGGRGRGNGRGDRGGNDSQEREPRNERGERGDRGERNDRGDRDGGGGRGGRGRGGGDREERNERGGGRGRDRDRDRDRGEEREERVPSNRPLTEAQRAYLDTLKSVLRVNVDGDWDDDMIRLAFDRLERLFDRIRRG